MRYIDGIIAWLISSRSIRDRSKARMSTSAVGRTPKSSSKPGSVTTETPDISMPLATPVPTMPSQRPELQEMGAHESFAGSAASTSKAKKVMDWFRLRSLQKRQSGVYPSTPAGSDRTVTSFRSPRPPTPELSTPQVVVTPADTAPGGGAGSLTPFGPVSRVSGRVHRDPGDARHGR